MGQGQKRKATRAPARPRKMRTRKLRVPRMIKGPQNATLMVKRTQYNASFVMGTAATNQFWNYFEPQLSNGFNTLSDFAALFDSFKVNGIRLSFKPRFDTLAGPTTGATPMTVAMPQITYCIDPDSRLVPSGAYVPATLNTLLEQGNTRTVRSTKDVNIYYKPKVSMPTNIGSGQYFRKPGWLDLQGCQSVPFRGVHVFFHNNNFSAVTQDIVYDLYITWYITFKNIK